MRALRFICAFFLTWIVGIESASARPVRVWTMDEIADKAEVLLVGEIVEISAVEKIDADKTRWNTPLLRMAAKIRVLRTFKRNGAPAIQQEQQSSRDRNHIKMSIRETCADADFIFQLLP